MSTPTRSPQRALLPEIVAWVLLLVGIQQLFVYLSVQLAGPGDDRWFLFSSDTVQYGLIYKDLFDLGFHFGGWNISHAPEYVQMAWAFFIRALSKDLVAAHVIEALVQPVLLALALLFLLRRLDPPCSIAGPASVATALLLVRLGVGGDLIAIFWSNRHGFTAILAVLGLGLWMRRGSGAQAFLLATLVAVATLSDLIFLVWFVGPLVLSHLIWSIVRRQSIEWKQLTLIVGAAIAGAALLWWCSPFVTVGEKVGIALDTTLGALGRIADDATNSSASQRMMTHTLLLGFVLGCGGAMRARNPATAELLLFSVLLTIASVASVALTAAPFREAGYTRYFLAAEIGAIVVVLAMVTEWRGGRALLVALLGVVTLTTLATRPAEVAPATRHYPPLVRCIDDVAKRHGLQFGVAEYWLAKYVTALSRTDLSVVSVTPRLDPFVRFSNFEWFLGGVGARRHDRPVYSFAILGTTRPDGPGVAQAALDAFGPPAAIETCEGFRIHVLPRGADERLRRQFAENPRLKAYYADRGYRLPVP